MPHAAQALKHPHSSAEDLFRAEVLAGLGAEPRTLSARWFYDRCDSELFEAITALPEHYPTRADAEWTDPQGLFALVLASTGLVAT
jgi:uncharacterized SAM-dependent methyltransferase